MELGTGVFLSSLFLGTVALYISTKDRWNWKKLLLWPVGIALGLSVISGVGIYVYSWVDARPKKQLGLWEIQLGTTPAEVKFAKGEPTRVDGDTWVYSLGRSASDDGLYLVRFRNGKVRIIQYYGSRLNGPSIQGISPYSSPGTLKEKFGEPTYISRSKDELRRIHSFADYNVFFGLEKNEIDSLGVFDSSTGPVKFSDEAK